MWNMDDALRVDGAMRLFFMFFIFFYFEALHVLLGLLKKYANHNQSGHTMRRMEGRRGATAFGTPTKCEGEEKR